MESETQKPSTYSLSEDPDSNIDKSLNDFRAKAGIASYIKIRIIDKTDAPDGFLISISYTGEQPVKTPELNQEVLVPAPVTAQLYLDKKGNLVRYQIKDPDPVMIDVLRGELNSKLRIGQIDIIDSGKKASAGELFAKKKPFYIEKDEQGKQHLKRAYFETH
jgi:hypothetical protein